LLESLSNSYSAIGQQIQFFKNLKRTEKESIPELQQEADRLNRRAREIELVFSKRKDVDALLAELAWRYAYDGEKVRISLIHSFPLTYRTLEKPRKQWLSSNRDWMVGNKSWKTTGYVPLVLEVYLTIRQKSSSAKLRSKSSTRLYRLSTVMKLLSK
jgi:hypothetical protein